MDVFDEIRDLELDEDLPKDLAKAFRNSFERPRDADTRKHKYGYGNIKGTENGWKVHPDIDFKNSTYTEITPEEALRLYKEGNSRNVYVILGGQLANTYLETDANGAQKRAYDFKAVTDGSEAFNKANGKAGQNSMWLSPKEFYNNASKIYLANEVPIDPAKINARADNPESKYNNGTANSKIPAPTLKTGNKPSGVQIEGNTATYRSGYVSDTRIPGVEKYAEPNGKLDPYKFYPVEVWKAVRQNFVSRGWDPNSDRDIKAVDYIIDQLENPSTGNAGPMDYDWRQHDRARNRKVNTRYQDVANTLQNAMEQGKSLAREISSAKYRLSDTISSKNRNTDPAEVARKKARIQRSIDEYKRYIDRYMRDLLNYQDQLEDVDADNDKAIAEYDRKIADIQANLADLQSKMRGLLRKPATEELQEDLNVITLTKEDQASNIRSLIKTCWDNVDAYSMYAAQLNEFGSQQALEVVNNLINDLYIAIGSFEDALGDVDMKSAAIEAPAQVEVVAQVAPQVVQQMAQAPVVPMIEKFVLPEEDVLTEELDEKPEAQEELEKPVENELKEVEKYRKEKIKDSLNPDQEKSETSNMEVDLDESVDDTYNPHFFESLLKLEEE